MHNIGFILAIYSQSVTMRFFLYKYRAMHGLEGCYVKTMNFFL